MKFRLELSLFREVICFEFSPPENKDFFEETELTKVSWLISPVSGANMDWTMNLCLFFSLGSNSKGWRLTAMLTSVLGSTTPELGFTQYLGGREEKTLSNLIPDLASGYLLGAVVFILKHTFLSDGFFNFM